MAITARDRQFPTSQGLPQTRQPNSENARDRVKVLFVHHSFPGQYRHIVRALAAEGNNRIIALSFNRPSEPIPKNVHVLRYVLERGNSPDIPALVLETETKVIRAEGCARAAAALRDQQSFRPDLICGHPGWGELLFLNDVWPGVPILSYQEFYHQPCGFDFGFDPEFQSAPTWRDRAQARMKNATLLLSLQSSNWNVSPTAFQRSTFPENWQNRISVIHDGIDTQQARPDVNVAPLALPDGVVLRRGQPIVTFVNRRLEPYRGCHTFIRCLPELQRLAPEAEVVIVGFTEGVSYGRACPRGSWKDVFLAEVEGLYDPSKVHFTGSLDYKEFLHLLKVSSAHVYLTYPFLLSWSLLEAMSCGCAVVGSATAPVQEVIDHGRTGLLVDFFKPLDLAAAVAELLADRHLAETLGAAARASVLQRYSLDHCVPQQLGLLQLVAGGAL